MKRTLITGANSFVGTSFERYISENFSNDFYIDTIDVKDSTWRDRSFSGFDTIFHVAAIVHIKETAENRQTYFDVNRDLTVEIAKKAKAEGVGQFVFLSSMSVYGLTTGVITKDTKPTPNTAYGISKKEAEEVILALSDSHFKIVVLRPPMIYGSGCKGNYLLLRKLALKLPLFPKVTNNRSMLYIGNLVEFVRLVIENDEEGVFYPQNTEYTNTSEMVKLIALANHKKVCLVSGFNWILKILSHVTDLVDKAFGDLTYDETMSCYPGGGMKDTLLKTAYERQRESNANCKCLEFSRQDLLKSARGIKVVKDSKFSLVGEPPISGSALNKTKFNYGFINNYSKKESFICLFELFEDKSLVERELWKLPRWEVS